MPSNESDIVKQKLSKGWEDEVGYLRLGITCQPQNHEMARLRSLLDIYYGQRRISGRPSSHCIK